jgi:uncharacterized protein (TIGR02118 family)
MYPFKQGARFDFQYYCTKHMELVRKHLGPFGLVKVEVDRGISGGGKEPPPYVCVAHLYFDRQDDYERGIAEAGSILRGDIPNFTDITPVRQVSEVLGPY